MGGREELFPGWQPKCPECGSRDIRFTSDTVLGVTNGLFFKINEDGTLGVGTAERYDKPLEPVLANSYDMNLHELAYCGGCSFEDEGYASAEDAE